MKKPSNNMFDRPNVVTKKVKRRGHVDGCGCNEVMICNLWNCILPRCGKGEDFICELDIQNVNNIFSLTWCYRKTNIP